MDFNLFSEKITRQYLEKLPFVVYALPDSSRISALFQKDDTLHSIEKLNESGFVMAPFEYNNSAFFIPAKNSESVQSELVKECFESNKVLILKDEIEENNYLKLIIKTIETIKKNKAAKIVISRPKDFELHNFSVEILLQRLFSIYPTAFRYIWFHPKTGLWCGATPETLVEIENNFFKTMALAGTQPSRDHKAVTWRPKEVDEQKQVTEMIIKKLKAVTSAMDVSKTYTHKAGSLLHLRTDIVGKLNKATTLTTLVQALHPTPAICGNPQNFAQDFIIENEGYPRLFYTGFLGPVNMNKSCATIMVNLRCMKIEDAIARVFVGGGITLDSNPIEEWQETQNKMQTMLQVLQPML